MDDYRVNCRYVDAYPEAFKRLEGTVQLGTNTITFRARSPNSNLNEICRMTVTAVQQQPPEVVYCPESFTIQLDEGETARLVYWKEPTFRATGHLKQLYKSKQSGDKFSIGEHYVSYVATDAEGQSSKCNFKVTLKGKPTVEAAVPVLRQPKTTTATGVAEHESYLLCPGRQPVRIPPNHNVSILIRLLVPIEGDRVKRKIRVRQENNKTYNSDRETRYYHHHHRPPTTKLTIDIFH